MATGCGMGRSPVKVSQVGLVGITAALKYSLKSSFWCTTLVMTSVIFLWKEMVKNFAGCVSMFSIGSLCVSVNECHKYML